MSFTTALWKVSDGRLIPIERSRLDSERQLEDWLVDDPSLLARDLLVIGRQVRTFGGPLDILAVGGDGDLVVIELKRDKTPREVVAQVLDYASWVRDVDYDALDRICQGFCGKSLAHAFHDHFQFGVPDAIGKNHSMVIVASELDESSERIVQYLQQEHSVNINAVYFTAFNIGGQVVLARSWLADPIETTDRIEAKKHRPWTGLWFVNTGVDEGRGRDWEACRKYGFISAGGGPRWSEPLYRLEVGQRILAYQKGRGYVGFGVISKPALPAAQFRVPDGQLLSDVLPELDRHRNDSEKCEHAVGVDWNVTFPIEEAKRFKGIFANQNVVCKLRDEPTVEFLKQQFKIDLD